MQILLSVQPHCKNNKQFRQMTMGSMHSVWSWSLMGMILSDNKWLCEIKKQPLGWYHYNVSVLSISSSLSLILFLFYSSDCVQVRFQIIKHFLIVWSKMITTPMRCCVVTAITGQTQKHDLLQSSRTTRERPTKHLLIKDQYYIIILYIHRQEKLLPHSCPPTCTSW